MKRLILFLSVACLLAGCSSAHPAAATPSQSDGGMTQISAITNTVIHPDSEEYDTQTLGLPEKFNSLLAGKINPSDKGQIGDILSCRTNGNALLAEIRRFEEENWWVVFDPVSNEYTWLIANAELKDYSPGKKIIFTSDYGSESVEKSFPTEYAYTKIGDRWVCQSYTSHLKFEQGVDFGLKGDLSEFKQWTLYDVLVSESSVELITDIQGNDIVPYTVITTNAIEGQMTITLQNCKTSLAENVKYSQYISFESVKVKQQGKDTQVILNLGRNGYITYYSAGKRYGWFKTTPDTGYMSTFVEFFDYESLLRYLLPEEYIQ